MTTKRVLGVGWRHHDDTDDDLDSLADEVVRLRAEIDRLRAILPPEQDRAKNWRYDHGYKWSASGPECGLCGSVHEPNREPKREG